MEDTKRQNSRDPDAESCFLIPSTEDHIDLSVQTSDVTISAPGITNHRNPVASDTIFPLDSTPTLPNGETSSNYPTLPNGAVITSKNTLQSFNIRSATRRVVPQMNVASNVYTTSNFPAETSTSVLHPQEPQTPNTNINAMAENIYVAELVADIPPRKTAIPLLAFGILVVATAVVIAGVCFSGYCGSSDSSKALVPVTLKPTPAPTASPTVAPIDVMVEHVVSAFVNNITYLGQEISVNGTSAESKALAWIIQDDPLFTDTKSALLDLNPMHDDEASFRVRQRYALATLWFQQADEEGVFIKTWETITGWLSKSECNWFGISCVNGSVIEIMFYNFDSDLANEYFGSIPPDIGLLTSLQTVKMYDNMVTGTIPESIGQCRRMKHFDIGGGGGSVSGTIPLSLGLWTDIVFYDVSQNAITGTIPESFGSWTNLTVFSVRKNKISGSIPSFVGQWHKILFLDFSWNMLTNTIPKELGNLGNITSFWVWSNRLTGTLPSLIRENDLNERGLQVFNNF
jgi:hypothetical protein